MTFSSVYEMFDPLTTVRKQRFWDWFSGDAVKAWWTERDVSGTGTFAMVDAADEGYSITTGAAASNNRSRIDFNNIRQYNEDSGVGIFVVRRVTASNAICQSGFHGDTATNPTDISVYRDNSSSTYKELLTGDSGSSSTSASTVAVDTSWTTAKITMGASSHTLHITGVLEITKSTDLPDNKLQPAFESRNITSAGAKENRIRYFEAYNT